MIFKTKDVCCQEIRVDVKDGIITELEFVQGCSGNLKGIAALAVGRDKNEIMASLKGITCNNRETSCPDQLVEALRSFDSQ